MKTAARRTILKKRDGLPHWERESKSRAIGKRLMELPEYRDAGSVLFYVEFRSEVITRPMIDEALADGKRVLVPKVEKDGHHLRLFHLSDPDSELVPGYMGIPEPDHTRLPEYGPQDVDLVVLPGVGFDSACGRLGYGGGYYDRLIEKLKPGTPLVALSFEAQVADKVPSESHDKPMDKVVTEERVIEAGQQI